MSSWKDVYEVLGERDLAHSNYPNREKLMKKYVNHTSDVNFLMHKPSGECIGQYKDFMYAVKQAKYKYRKTEKAVEKILLKKVLGNIT